MNEVKQNHFFITSELYTFIGKKPDAMPYPGEKRSLGFSFLAAFRGLYLAFSKERNARIHLIAVVLVTSAGWFFNISGIEWIAILLLFALVIASEMINTAIEKLADVSVPAFSNQVRDLKDISAGAVLWTSIVAFIIGIIIFAPEILAFIRINLNQQP